MAKAHRIVAYIFLGMVAVSLASLGSCEFRREKYERGFAQIKVGDSKQNVTELLGESSEIEGCNPGADEKLRESCAEVYVYYSFMERRGFLLDKEGRVTHKYYNVSY